MKRFKALVLAGITAAMLIGCGNSDDDAVVGISIEKLEDVAPVVEASVEASVEEANEDMPPQEGMGVEFYSNIT